MLAAAEERDTSCLSPEAVPLSVGENFEHWTERTAGCGGRARGVRGGREGG